MNAQLFIGINGLKPEEFRGIEFFSAESWNRETEANLLRLVSELLSVIRNEVQSLRIEIIVNSKNPFHLISLVLREQKKGLAINKYTLSGRELEVLTLLMNGYTNKEIADKLFICYETVKSHRKNILLKTGCRNTAALINHYYQTFFEK